MTPKRLRPGMSAAVRTRGDARAGGRPGGEVAEAEGGARVRRADRPQRRGRRRGQRRRRSARCRRPWPAVEPWRRGRRPRRPAAGPRRRVGGAGVADGGDDLAVAGAAAEDAAERVRDLGLARARRCGRGGRVRPSACRACRCRTARRRGEEGAPAAGASARRRQPLDGGRPRRPATCADRRQAGADRLAVEQHGAGAAVAGVAADLGAGEAEPPRAARPRAAGSARPRRRPARPLRVKPSAGGASASRVRRRRAPAAARAHELGGGLGAVGGGRREHRRSAAARRQIAPASTRSASAGVGRRADEPRLERRQAGAPPAPQAPTAMRGLRDAGRRRRSRRTATMAIEITR